MKRLLIAFAFMCMLVSPALAGVRTPMDQSGKGIPTIDWVGASACTLTSAMTSSVATLCTASPAILYGVVASTDAASLYVTVVDTNTVVGSTPTATVQIIGATAGIMGDSGRLAAPIKFTKGIRAAMSGTMATNATWTLIYRLYTATE